MGRETAINCRRPELHIDGKCERCEVDALRSLVRAVYRDSWMEDGVQMLACGGLTALTDEQHAVLYRSLNEGMGRQ